MAKRAAQPILLLLVLLLPSRGSAQEGLVKEYYDNGVLQFEKSYKNGKLDGLSRAYYRDGSLMWESIYKEGQREGLSKSYHSNGQISSISNYQEDKLEGPLTAYRENGKIRLERSFKAGKQDGWEREYNEDERVTASCHYKDGRRDGLCQYFENGRLTRESHFKNGERDGSYKLYYENGQVKEEIPYREDLREGLAKGYYPDGKPGYEVDYKDGQRNGIAKSYYPDGRLRTEATFKDDKQEGPYKEYDPDGKIKREIHYKDGKPEDSSRSGATAQPFYTVKALGPVRTGRIHFIVIDPKNPNTIYVRSERRKGFIKSTDGGAHWFEISPSLKEHIPWILLVDPNDTNTLYASTTAGIYKSTDGGGEWTEINKRLKERSANALALDPKRPQVLYAGTSFKGIFKTTNGGKEWFEINRGLAHTWVTSIAIDPKDSNIVYAGTRGGALFKSMDQGESWSEIAFRGSQVEALQMDSKSPSTLYACIDNRNWHRSTDGGLSWSEIKTNFSTGCPSTFFIDPNQADTLYMGGIGMSAGLRKTVNAGKNWVDVHPQFAKGGVTAIAAHPKDSGTLYVGTQEGLFKTTDGGGAWAALTKIPRPRTYKWVESESPVGRTQKVEVTEEEQAAVRRAAERFTAELLAKNDFVRLFQEGFFVEDYFDYPARFSGGVRLDDEMLQKANKETIKQLVLVNLNFSFHMMIDMFSQFRPNSRPDPDRLAEPPSVVKRYLEEQGVEAEEFLGVDAELETVEDLKKRIALLKGADQRLKQEIEKKSLIQSELFQQWIVTFRSMPELGKVRKEIVTSPYAGHPVGTTLYTVSDLTYVLLFVKQGEQFKIAWIGPVSH